MSRDQLLVAMKGSLDRDDLPRRRGRPPNSLKRPGQELALRVHRKAFELGGGRGSQAQAIRELYPRSSQAQAAVKKMLQRHPLAREIARFEHSYGQWERYQAMCNDALKEFDHRLRNIPRELRYATLGRMPLRECIQLLRKLQINGDFPTQEARRLLELMSPK